MFLQKIHFQGVFYYGFKRQKFKKYLMISKAHMIILELWMD